jgi:pimeloyl-ACP methyl ester carboxylesterase
MVHRLPSSQVPSIGEATMATNSKPGIVFAHGLWADGSCYSKLIPTLQADGHEVISTQNSLDTVDGDVAAVRRALGRVNSPAILVGHSYGGAVISAAGVDNRVAALVYIAALAPDDGDPSQLDQDKFPKTAVFNYIDVAEGRIWLKPEGIESFAGDLSVEEQKLVWATQGAPTVDLFNQKVKGAAWKSKPSWYIVAKSDRTIQPELERFLAKRMRATTIEVESSHVPMLSNPKVVIEAIRAAASAVQGVKAAAA